MREPPPGCELGTGTQLNWDWSHSQIQVLTSSVNGTKQMSPPGIVPQNDLHYTSWCNKCCELKQFLLLSAGVCQIYTSIIYSQLPANSWWHWFKHFLIFSQQKKYKNLHAQILSCAEFISALIIYALGLKVVQKEMFQCSQQTESEKKKIRTSLILQKRLNLIGSKDTVKEMRHAQRHITNSNLQLLQL